MENMIPCPVKDQAVFQRVWQRVMAGRDQASSPIQPGSPVGHGDLSCQCLEALMRQEDGIPPECGRDPQGMGWLPPEQPSQEAPPAPEPPAWEAPPEQPEEDLEAPAPEPSGGGERPCAAPPEAAGPHRGNDLPPMWAEPQAAGDRTARLRRHVMDTLEGWQFYRHLAKRARGTDARMLSSLAGELHKEARKLSAAYFLLTGLRYWPSELLGLPAISSYWGALRQRHQAEQRQETAFRLAADDWEDPEVLALYQELAESCQRRCRQLRSLLERDET